MADLIDRQTLLLALGQTVNNGKTDEMRKCVFAVLEYCRQIIEMQQTVDSAPQWIPCSERLPESVGNKVIVFCTGEDVNDYVGFGHYEKFKHIETWYNLETSFPFADWGLTVTHWMPLPEPPKDGGE